MARTRIGSLMTLLRVGGRLPLARRTRLRSPRRGPKNGFSRIRMPGSNRRREIFSKMFSRALADHCTLATKESVRDRLHPGPGLQEVKGRRLLVRCPHDPEAYHGRPGRVDSPAAGDLQLHPQQDPRTGLRPDGPRDRLAFPDQEPQRGDVPPQGPSEEGADPSRTQHVARHPVARGPGQRRS